MNPKHERTRPGALCLGALTLLSAAAPQGDEPVPVPGDGVRVLGAEIREVLTGLEATEESWPSEVFKARVQEALEAAVRAPGGDVRAFVTAEIEGDALVPGEMDVRELGSLRIRSPRAGSPERFRGAEAFARELSLLRGGRPDTKVDFSIVRIRPPETPGPGTLEATVEVMVRSATAGSALQRNATWSCTFALEDGQVRLSSVDVDAYTEVERAGGFQFVDATAAAFGGNESFRAQLVQSLPHWRGRIDARLGTSILGHQGLALGDVDGDGLEDLYLCQPSGLPNLLYRRLPDGRLDDISEVSGADFLEFSSSAIFIDLDGDGDVDLAVVVHTDVLFLENDGEGHFTRRATHPARTLTSMAAADYDGDGDLDVYACGYVNPYDGQGTPVPYHDANNGEPNILLANLGDWRFADVTEKAGLDVNNRRFSFAASFEDYDNDGDQDLYVANDYGRNNLYRNDGGRFVDVAQEAGVEDVSAGMGVSWADADNDGWMDLYVSNMFSSAGNRVTYQRRFRAAADETERAQFQRHARGNTLFKNRGDGGFDDVSLSAGVTHGHWAWGAVFVDLDNDGLRDLFVPNGFVTGERQDDL